MKPIKKSTDNLKAVFLGLLALGSMGAMFAPLPLPAPDPVQLESLPQLHAKVPEKQKTTPKWVKAFDQAIRAERLIATSS